MKLELSSLAVVGLFSSPFAQAQGEFRTTAGFDDLTGVKADLSGAPYSNNPVKNPYSGLIWEGFNVIDTTGVEGPIQATTYPNTIAFKANESATIQSIPNGNTTQSFTLLSGYFGCFKEIGPIAPVNCSLRVEGNSQNGQGPIDYEFIPTKPDGSENFGLQFVYFSGAFNSETSVSLSANPTVLNKGYSYSVLLDSITYTVH